MKSIQIRAIHGFTKQTDADVIARATAVHTGLFNHPLYYPNPPLDLITLKATIDRYAVALADALDGGKKAIAEKNHQRAVVIGMLRLLARYVEFHCKNDLAILSVSGFEPAATVRAIPQQLQQPNVRKIEQGDNSGQLRVRLSAVPKAIVYELRYAAVGEGGLPAEWMASRPVRGSGPVSIDGLKPGTIYAFQVRALGRIGYTDWSDSATRMVI